MSEKTEAKGSNPSKVFNVKQLIGKIHLIQDEDLGEIRYGELTLADALEINSKKNLTLQDRSLLMICKMLQKADPEVTLEDLKQLPATEATRLITVMTGKSGFLQVKKQKTPSQT